jgi:hypothetical protein
VLKPDPKRVGTARANHQNRRMTAGLRAFAHPTALRARGTLLWLTR